MESYITSRLDSDFKSMTDYDVLNLSNDSNFQDLANVVFWRDRALVKGYISKLDEFGDDNVWPENNDGIRTPKERYIQLLSKTSCVPGSEKYIDNQSRFPPYNICLRSAREGNLDGIKYFLEKGGNINAALHGAAHGGHLDLVKYLIDEKGANDINNAIKCAAFGGHLDLVKYLIDEKGGINLNDALAYAAKGGHLDLVKYLIDEKGVNFFTDSLNYAIRAGKIEIVKYLIEEKKAQIFYINSSLHDALKYKHIDIFQYLYDTNRNTNINIDNEVLPNLAADGLLDAVKYLIEGKYANDLNQTLDYAIRAGKIEIVKYLIEEKGVTDIYNNAIRADCIYD